MPVNPAKRSALVALVDMPGRGWLSTSATAWHRLSEADYEELVDGPLVERGFDRGGNARVRITDAGRAALRGES